MSSLEAFILKEHVSPFLTCKIKDDFEISCVLSDVELSSLNVALCFRFLCVRDLLRCLVLYCIDWKYPY